MKVQTPAEGILKKNSWGDAKSYQVVCECSDPDHDHNVWVEADDSGISVTIYTTVKSPWWSMNRFKQIWTLITKGYIQQESILTMSSQTAVNYAETLKSAIRDVANFRKENTQNTDVQNEAASKLANETDCV